MARPKKQLADAEAVKMRDVEAYTHDDKKRTNNPPVGMAQHDKAEENGIAHMGGYALINYFRTHMGKEYFERIAQSASSWAIEAIT